MSVYTGSKAKDAVLEGLDYTNSRLCNTRDRNRGSLGCACYSIEELLQLSLPSGPLAFEKQCFTWFPKRYF